MTNLRRLYANIPFGKLPFSTVPHRQSSKMSQRNVVFTAQAPNPIGPYSQAVRHGNTLYCSGQIGVNPTTRQLVSDKADEQANQAFTNLRAVIEAAGSSMDNVAKVNIFITDFDNFGPINEVMKKFFQEPFPARSTVAVAGLPLNCLVEIEAIVGLNERSNL